MRSVFMIIALLGVAVPAPAQSIANVPVDALDLQRYSGQWHEIAHLPMFFQRKCVSDITATYTPLASGEIGVRNACRTKKGTEQSSDGIARTVAGKPGQLQVRFAPRWLAWVPGVWADYWIVDVDPEYQWAVVGGPDMKYMWILSRSATMDRALFERLTERAARRGYPVGELVMAAELES